MTVIICGFEYSCQKSQAIQGWLNPERERMGCEKCTNNNEIFFVEQLCSFTTNSAKICIKASEQHHQRNMTQNKPNQHPERKLYAFEQPALNSLTKKVLLYDKFIQGATPHKTYQDFKGMDWFVPS